MRTHTLKVVSVILICVGALSMLSSLAIVLVPEVKDYGMKTHIAGVAFLVIGIIFRKSWKRRYRRNGIFTHEAA